MKTMPLRLHAQENDRNRFRGRRPHPINRGRSIPWILYSQYKIIVAVLLMVACIPAGASADLAAYLQEGKLAIEDGRFEFAVSSFTGALSLLEPDDPAVCSVLLGRAQAYLGQRKFSEAMTDVNRALQCRDMEGDSLAGALRLRGTIYDLKGRKDLALKDLTESIKVFPQSQQPLAVTFTVRGFVLTTLGKLGRAQGDFKKAIQLDPDLPRAYAGLGLAYQKKGKDKRARRAAEKALSMNPDEETARIARQVLAGNFDRNPSTELPRNHKNVSRAPSTKGQSVQQTTPHAGSIAVPFRMDGHIHVQVSFGDGRPYWFMLDTGASHSLVKRSLLERIKNDTVVQQIGKRQARLADGSFVVVTAYLVKDAHLYHIPLGDILISVADGPSGRASNLLGIGSLENVTVYLDRASREAIIAPRQGR